jgi:predicted DNA-binding transcriptional regulator YafY
MTGPMPRDDQLSRQWRLLQIIEHPHCVTVDDAARDLKCTLRTIWRDLDVLQQVGFPLYTESAAGGTRGVWRVTEDKRTLPARAMAAPR